jgi:peptide/nickel transport system substrate-binding protein
LTDLVTAKKLPPVEQRLPSGPYVAPHAWLAPGNYGGQLQLVSVDRSGWDPARYVPEFMYGHSPLRWLDDGLTIGPGLVESWETNADQSSWVLHFRKGLHWSDGQPWTTDDVLFWWNDELPVGALGETIPPEARSAKGTPMKLVKVDATTLVLLFDRPAPLVPDFLASWVKRGVGPRWMDPKHYLQQFHPTYNPAVDKTNWTDHFASMRDFATNPACPTLTGWMLKSYVPGQSAAWVRNPFYWAIDRNGNQLPYLDGITLTSVADSDTLMQRITSGKVDYVLGGFVPLALDDVETLREAQATSGLELRFWDSGSGTGSLYCFNYDYSEPKLRALIREPSFRKALSLAYDRASAREEIYYATGELTTGTLSPKAHEYHVAGGATIYAQWRDSAVAHDSATANKLLDELHVVDSDGDGWRDFPDGSPLSLTLDYPSDTPPTSADARKNALLLKGWQAVGINVKLNPVSPDRYAADWAAGKILLRSTGEVADGPTHLIQPRWLVPIDAQGWAPLEGQYYAAIGTPLASKEINVDPYQRTPPRLKPEADGPVQKLWDIYNRAKLEPDPVKRTQAVWEMVRIHIADGPFFSGTTANPPTLVLVKAGLLNVPKRNDLTQHGFTGSPAHPTPAVYDPETWFWDVPANHA